MKPTQIVNWTRGMFLGAQHFQAMSLALSAQLNALTTMGRSSIYGLTAIRADEDSLKNGLLSIQRARGVFPDGLYFDVPGSDRQPSSINAATFLPVEAGEGDVFLAVPERRHGSPNIAFEGGPTLRYTARDTTFIDEIDGFEETVEVAEANLQLFVGDRPTGMSTLRIGRIFRTQGDSFRFDADFIPPCLSIDASSRLIDELLPGLLQSLAFFSRKLSAERSEQSDVVADAMDETRFRVLSMVNAALPELQHFITVRQVHPEVVFRFLLSLAGSLCTFSKEFEPLKLPGYDHEHLGDSFGGLVDAIKRMLNTIVFPKNNIVPIELAEIGMWAWEGAIKDESLLRRATFLVCFRSTRDVDEAELRRVIKISGPNRMEDVQGNALTGAELKLVEPPVGRPRRSRARYFEIRKRGTEWDDVVETRKIQLLLLLPDPQKYDPELEILAVLD